MPKRSALMSALALAPTAIGSGIAREVTAQKVNPSFVHAPVAKPAWILDGVLLAIGAAGAITAHVTGDNAWGDWTNGALAGGLIYGSQDLTHAAYNKLSKSTATPAAPAQVMFAQPAMAAAAPMPAGFGGSEY